MEVAAILWAIIAHARRTEWIPLIIQVMWDIRKVMAKIEQKYRTRTIITRGLHIFNPIFHCGLYCREVSFTDNLSMY